MMSAEASSLTWIEIVGLTVVAGLSAGVGSTIVNHLFGWFRDHREATRATARDATYLATRVAVVLEKFAINCANQISDNDMYQQSDGCYGRSCRTLPVLGEYPADADWKTLEPTLLIRVLSVPNELLKADQRIEFILDGDPDPFLSIHTDPHTDRCGYRAWKLAADLRRRYKLPGFEPEDIARGSVRILKEYHDRELQLAEDDAAGQDELPRDRLRKSIVPANAPA